MQFFGFQEYQMHKVNFILNAGMGLLAKANEKQEKTASREKTI